jgi:hypothetical protein
MTIFSRAAIRPLKTQNNERSPFHGGNTGSNPGRVATAPQLFLDKDITGNFPLERLDEV